MAYCEYCNANVLPGDLYTVQEGIVRHYYCSFAHFRALTEEKTLEIVPSKDAGRSYEVKGVEAVLPPAVPDPPAENEFVCDICDFVAKNKAGLRAHLRAKHK